MDTQSIISELEAERERVENAITALQGSHNRLGRPKGSTDATNGRKGRRHLSAAARKRISEGMKARWAKAKRTGKNSL